MFILFLLPYICTVAALIMISRDEKTDEIMRMYPEEFRPISRQTRILLTINIVGYTLCLPYYIWEYYLG